VAGVEPTSEGKRYLVCFAIDYGTEIYRVQTDMAANGKETITSILIEVVVYAGLVTAYFFLVLHFLGGWLSEIYHRDRRLYAAVALCLIVGQGVVLETLTTALLLWIRSKMD